MLTGAKADPGGALLVWLAVRMGRYLSGPVGEPIEELVPAYLSALEALSAVLGIDPADAQGEKHCPCCMHSLQSSQLLL